MGSLAARMMLDKDVEIVGAIARSDEKVGKDLGEVAGLGRTLGVTVQRNADAVLNDANADIAVIAVDSYLTDHAPRLESCARAGTNAITLSEESLYPWLTSPDTTQRLDQLAKENGVTLTGGGCQDAFWLGLVWTLMGAAHRIDSVSGYTNWNVDDFGPEVARDMRIGETPDEGAETASAESGESPPSFGLPALQSLIAGAGLTIAETTSESRPNVAAEPVPSKALETTIEAGRIIGLSEVDRIVTAEGVVFQLEVTGHIYSPGETDLFEWIIEGEPNMKLRTPDMDARTAPARSW